MKKNKRLLIFFSVLISIASVSKIAGNIWREMTSKEIAQNKLPIVSWAPLVEPTRRAVAVISTESVVQSPDVEVPGLPLPFRMFMPMPPEKMQGQGSGFVINEEGYVLTNEHVIAGAQKIKIKVGNNPREFDAEVIGKDAELDIALVKIKLPDNEKIVWEYLSLGDSDKVNIGDPLMAVGSPLGLSYSASFGWLSHTVRGGIRPSGRDLFVELMQLQIPINPGNSGGPIVDISGQVVGVAESVSAQGQSIAFMVPINIVKKVMSQLVSKGKIEKAYLGVDPTDLTSDFAKALGLSLQQTGAIIKQVFPGTPALKAGLKPMDAILEVDGTKVTDAFKLRQITAYGGVGSKVLLKVFRKGEGIKNITVILESRPGQEDFVSAQSEQQKPEKTEIIAIDSIGLKVIDTPKEVIASQKLTKANLGAFVIQVQRMSASEFAGIAPKDVILKVGDESIKDAQSLKSAIDKIKSDTPVLMHLKRGDQTIFIPFRKP